MVFLTKYSVYLKWFANKYWKPNNDGKIKNRGLFGLMIKFIDEYSKRSRDHMKT